MYDEDTGERKQYAGQPIRRPTGTNPPCGYPGKRKGTTRCPKGTPDSATDLWIRNQTAYRHYQRCQAVGRFPEDDLVERNAAIIWRIETAAAESRAMLRDQLSRLSAMAGRR